MPAVVVEGRTAGAALARSKWLTEGRKGQVFALSLVFGMVFLFGGMLAGAALVLSGGELDEIDVTSWGFWAFELVLLLVMGLWEGVASTVVYHRLRELKEGVELSQIAAVFD